MVLSDLHTHTRFSDGAGSVEGNVRAAVRKNLVSIGISDHSPTPYDQSYCVKEKDTERYLREIRKAKETFRGRIEVYAGLEWDGLVELPNRDNYDYVIGDVHYLKTPEGYHPVDHSRGEQERVIEAFYGGDPIAYARDYYETYVRCAREHRPDFLGHIDLVTKFGVIDEEDRTYRAMAVEALAACLEIVPVIEVNTGPMTRGWENRVFPRTFLLREILERGGRVTLSSDAHRSGNIAGRFAEAAELLRSAGFRSHAVMRGGEFTDEAL